MPMRWGGRGSFIICCQHDDNARQPQLRVCPIINMVTEQVNSPLTHINWPSVSPVTF